MFSLSFSMNIMQLWPTALFNKSGLPKGDGKEQLWSSLNYPIKLDELNSTHELVKILICKQTTMPIHFTFLFQSEPASNP